MRSTQRICTVLLLWLFATALPLRPVMVILHNLSFHSSPHLALHFKTNKGPERTDTVLQKHFHILKRIDKYHSRSNFIGPSHQVCFLERNPKARLDIPQSLPELPPQVPTPLRI